MLKSLILFSLLLISCATTPPEFSGQVIKLKEKKGMHFVEITLNGIKSKLLLDTGASKSLLDISQAEVYGFNYTLLSKNQYVGLGGLLDVYITYDYKVVEFFIPFLGADLSEIQNYFKKDGIFIVGVLGSDFLESKMASINFETNKLYLK